MFQLFTVVLNAVMIRDTNNCTFFVIKVKPFASQSYKLYWSELFRNLSRSFLHVRGNFLGVKRTNRPSCYVATLYILLHTNIIVWPKHTKNFDTKDTLITSLFSFAKARKISQSAGRAFSHEDSPPPPLQKNRRKRKARS